MTIQTIIFKIRHGLVRYSHGVNLLKVHGVVEETVDQMIKDQTAAEQHEYGAH